VSVKYNSLATEFETPPDNSSRRTGGVSDVIPANGEAGVIFMIQRALKEGQSPEIFYIHVWGEAVYQDVISHDSRSTKFRFRLRVKQIRGDGSCVQDGDWIKFGSADDNRAT
jgi:hypothetical protein